ncbi:hypothetical protein V2J09_005301 [Rumex salicifolius]
MSHEAPKLYVNKPKKAQLKQVPQHNLKEMESATATTGSTTTAGGGGSGSAAPQPPRESFIRRYRFLWPLLLGVNFAVGAYLFARTKKKDIPVEEEAPTVSVHPSVTSTTPAVEQPLPSPPTEPVKLCEPIPENQQRQLYKWMLEEKRKIKPQDSEEKKRLDEEKAILKQFIRAKCQTKIAGSGMKLLCFSKV